MSLKRENTIHSLNDNKIEDHFGIKIQELPFVNKINLRINPNNNKYMSSCGKILEAILPIKPNTYAKNENVKIMWLSPDEWLVVNNKDSLLKKLKEEIGNLEASVTDISENRTIIRISGEKVYTLLSKFMVLDLEKNLSDNSSCAQTLFVKVPILLVRAYNDKQVPTFEIYVNRSQANYIYRLLVDGATNLDF